MADEEKQNVESNIQVEKKQEEENTTKPDSDPQIAEDATAKPDSDPQKAEDATANPDSDPQIAEDATAKPDSDPQVAEDATAKPDSDPEVVEDATSKPDSDPQVVEDAMSKPDSDPQVAEDAMANAASDPQVSEEATTNPDSDLQVSEEATTKTDSDPLVVEEATTKTYSDPQVAEEATAKLDSDPQVDDGSSNLKTDSNSQAATKADSGSQLAEALDSKQEAPEVGQADADEEMVKSRMIDDTGESGEALDKAVPQLEDKPEVSKDLSVTDIGTDIKDLIDSDETVNVNLDATATVKFVMMPSGQVVTLACTLGQTLQQLKEHFSTQLKIPTSLILILHNGKTVEEGLSLADLGVGPNSSIQLEMQSSDPANAPIKSYRPRQEYHMPDVITVRVTGDDNVAKEVVVEIERARRKKPFLGGFKHRSTGLEYHNAAAQTTPKTRPITTVPRFCRDTQTAQQRHRLQQTHNETSTQMTNIGVFVSNMPDKLLIPGKYTTADEHLTMLLHKTILIQKYCRRWLAKRYVRKLKQDKQRRLDWEKEEEIRKKKDKDDRIKKEFERRMNPKRKEDFDLLYHALKKWREEEVERIEITVTGAERKAALCVLLEQETQLLAAIDRHKLEAGVGNKDLRIQNFLEKSSAPKKWKGFDGKTTEMDTPYTIRARELRDIYNSINMKYMTQDERLDVLLTLKHTVKEHDCKLTQEIIELIDREADLMMRGVRESNLDGLRKRVSTLFLQYIKTPTFNPEAAKLLKVPQDPSALRKNIYYCAGCSCYLPSTEFFLSSNSRSVGRCRQCVKIDNDARTRRDFTHFRYMLKLLCKAEEEFNDDSRIAFLLQDNDVHYLVENIWNNQSILSAWDDLYDLVLVRWDKLEEWSPWNCVLLTKDEASAHTRLETLEDGYGHVFVQKVKQKHTLARNYFSRLPGMSELIRQATGKRDAQSNSGPSVAGTSLRVQPKSAAV